VGTDWLPLPERFLVTVSHPFWTARLTAAGGWTAVF
jgi:hypothetical protein